MGLYRSLTSLKLVIDEHYKKQFGPNWIVTQAKKNLLLENEANEIISLEKTYRNKNIYNHDKMVASFHFGFWTYLFSRRNLPTKFAPITQKSITI